METTFIGLPCHRFSVNHTSKTYDQVIAGMANSAIVEIQDFSENYTCLLPEEIISIHWTQEQATVYPVVVLRKIDNVLNEDHFTFTSDDMKHDVTFVELCNDMIHTHYTEINVNIDLDMEFNDGCASQFKCIQAIHCFFWRNMWFICVYFETSHGKNKSDGLGGVVKGYASREVGSKNVLMHNAKELHEFCKGKLEVSNLEKG